MRFCLLLIVAATLHAQDPGRPFPEIPTVSVDGERGFNDEPALARATDGSYYVAWLSYQGSDRIELARFEKQGNSLRKLAEWPVVGGKGTFVSGIRLISAGNRVFLAYAIERGANWDIVALSAGPEGPGKPLTITSNAAINIKPDLAWHNGTLWVAWESNRANGRHIFASSARGAQVSVAQQISKEGRSNYGPSIAITGDGRVSVAWHSYRLHNYDVYLRQSGAGGAWGDERRITLSPAIDRHARLLANQNDIWVSYENAEIEGYRIGTSNTRRILTGRLTPNGIETPVAYKTSGLLDRAESSNAGFDESGRLWIAHLRPRLPRGGWEVHVSGFNGEKWTPLRVSLRKGMDRMPGIAVDKDRVVVAFQTDEFPETWTNADPHMTQTARSRILLASIDLRQSPPYAGRFATEPLSEPANAFEASRLHARYGEDAAAPEIEYKGRKLKLFYGDLHSHSDVSVCNRCGDQSIDEDFQLHRDLSRLDFAAVTDHGYNIVPYLWNYSAKLVRMNTDPGRILPFLGQEWTSSIERYDAQRPYGYYGHRNLIFADTFFPKFWDAMGTEQTPAELWAELRRMKANFVQIPHQLADTGNVPTDWSYTDEQAQPVAEIFQVRGSYEYKGAPREAPRSTPKGWFIQDAWAKGAIIGVIASPDHGGGLGKAAVWATDFSREAVLDAIRQRHTFGTTAARVVMDVRVNGSLMGEKAPAPDGKPVEVAVDVRAAGDIAKIDVCRNNVFVYSSTNPRFTYRDAAPLEGKSYYYVRVQQKDGEIAWSSPVWLGVK